MKRSVWYPHIASSVFASRYKITPGAPNTINQKMAAKIESLPFSNTDSIVARLIASSSLLEVSRLTIIAVFFRASTISGIFSAVLTARACCTKLLVPNAKVKQMMPTSISV